MKIKTNGKPRPAGAKPKPEIKPAVIAEAKPIVTPTVEAKPVITPQPEPRKPIAMANVTEEINNLWDGLSLHARQIAELQETLARKRKPPASSSKVKIRDKQTGKGYPSKNNAYQTLLRSGALKALVDKGVFGEVPEKNTFGWYALKREMPDRFGELKEGDSDGKAQAPAVAAPIAR